MASSASPNARTARSSSAFARQASPLGPAKRAVAFVTPQSAKQTGALAGSAPVQSETPFHTPSVESDARSSASAGHAGVQSPGAEIEARLQRLEAASANLTARRSRAASGRTAPPSPIPWTTPGSPFAARNEDVEDAVDELLGEDEDACGAAIDAWTFLKRVCTDLVQLKREEIAWCETKTQIIQDRLGAEVETIRAQMKEEVRIVASLYAEADCGEAEVARVEKRHGELERARREQIGGMVVELREMRRNCQMDVEQLQALLTAPSMSPEASLHLERFSGEWSDWIGSNLAAELEMAGVDDAGDRRPLGDSGSAAIVAAAHTRAADGSDGESSAASPPATMIQVDHVPPARRLPSKTPKTRNVRKMKRNGLFSFLTSAVLSPFTARASSNNEYQVCDSYIDDDSVNESFDENGNDRLARALDRSTSSVSDADLMTPRRSRFADAILQRAISGEFFNTKTPKRAMQPSTPCRRR